MNPQVLFLRFINKVWKSIEHEGNHHSNIVLQCQDHTGKLNPLLSVQGRDLPLSYLPSYLWDYREKRLICQGGMAPAL